MSCSALAACRGRDGGGSSIWLCCYLRTELQGVWGQGDWGSALAAQSFSLRSESCHFLSHLMGQNQSCHHGLASRGPGLFIFYVPGNRMKPGLSAISNVCHITNVGSAGLTMAGWRYRECPAGTFSFLMAKVRNSHKISSLKAHRFYHLIVLEVRSPKWVPLG